MINYYEVLGISDAASFDEIRRAYRILARRYHPDVNPSANSSDKFRMILAAYEALSDEGRRLQFNRQLQQARSSKGIRQSKDSFSKAEFIYRQKDKNIPSKFPSALFKAVGTQFSAIFENFKQKLPIYNRNFTPQAMEVSLTIDEALQGVKKTIEIEENNQKLKLAVKIPPGVRNGSIVRFITPKNRNKSFAYFLVIRILDHPSISISGKGVVMEIPLVLNDAIYGISTETKGLYGESIKINIPPGTQSGNEFAIIGKGIKYNNGSRGDLFVRVLIYVPDNLASQNRA